MSDKTETNQPSDVNEYIQKTLMPQIEKAMKGEITSGLLNSISSGVRVLIAGYRTDLNYLDKTGRLPEMHK